MEPLPILLGLLVSGAAAAALLVATRAPPARRLLGPAARRTLAIGCAYAAGHLLVTGWPGWPPPSVTGRLFWLVAASAAAACALMGPAFGAPRRRFVACAAAAAIPALLLRPLFASTWSPAQGAAMLVACALACLGAWYASLPLERAMAPGPYLGHLAFCAGGAAAVISLAGSLGFACMAGALCAATAAAAILARFLEGGERGAGTGVLVLGILASILIASSAYAELPWWGAACLWLATLAGWAARVPACAGLQGWKRAALILGASGALMVPPFVAALLATLEMQGE